MKKQTAVEWFSEKLNEFNGDDNPWFDIPLSLLEQAKAMEKEQIINAHNYGEYNSQFRSLDDENGKEYYNITYKP